MKSKFLSWIGALLLMASPVALAQSQFSGGNGNGTGSGTVTGIAPGVGLSNGANSTAAITGSGTLNAAVVISNTGTGGDVCLRAINQQIAFPGRTVSAQNDGANTLQDCGTDDLQTSSAVGTILMPSGGIRTSVGFHVGDRDNIFGEGTGNGGNTGTGPKISTNYLVNSLFPTNIAGGTGIQVNGAGQSGTTLSIKLTSGGPLQLAPGDTFLFPGDSTQYNIKNCAGAGSSPCSTTVQGGAGTSFYYTLTTGAPITINITPTLATAPADSTAITLIAPVWSLGEQNTTCSGCSAQDSTIKFGFINGDSSNENCIGGFAGQAAQENTRFEDMLVRNCGIGFRIFGAPDSGVYRNLNVAYNITVSTCPTPGNGVLTFIPYDFGVGHYSVDRTTAFVDSCTAAELPFGMYYIHDNPISSVGGGTFTLSNSHGEMCGAWNGSNSCSSGALGGDNIFVASTSGSVRLIGIVGCPSSFPCLNLVHVAATFGGTLDVEQTNCNSGTTNWMKDDLNGNTLLCAVSTSGDFYRISADGTVFTNVDCAHMTKGWCYNQNGWAIYNTGTKYAVTSSGLIGAYDGFATTGLGMPFQVANNGATGVTIGTGTSLAPASLCATAQCPSGIYEIQSYILITTPCTTGGSYSTYINFNDSGGTKSATTQLIAYNGINGPLASSAVVPTAGTYGSGTFILQTTGTANQALGSINYGTTAVACGTGGPMVGKLFLIVYRLG